MKLGKYLSPEWAFYYWKNLFFIYIRFIRILNIQKLLKKFGFDHYFSVYVVDQQVGYEMQYRYLAEKNSKHTSVVVQFKAEACADPSAKCLGNTKRDQYELYITGTDKVNFGAKDEQECLGTLRNGFIGEKAAPTVTDDDMTPCIAWTNNYWN